MSSDDKESKLFIEEYNNNVFSFFGRIERKSFIIWHCITIALGLLILELATEILYIGYADKYDEYSALYGCGDIFLNILFIYCFSAHLGNIVKRMNDAFCDKVNFIIFIYIFLFMFLIRNGFLFIRNDDLFIFSVIDFLVFIIFAIKKSYDGEVARQGRLYDVFFENTYMDIFYKYVGSLSSVIMYFIYIFLGLILYIFTAFIFVVGIIIGGFLKIKDKIFR